MAACSLTLLGGFDLRSADGKDLALSTRKDRLLLAHLALNAGRALPRDRLAGLLWGDRGETQARDSLRQSLAAIRQAFRQVGLDPILADRELLTFEPSGIDIDVAEFARLAGDGNPDKAAVLYRGDLLEGINGVALEFETWLNPERERLASMAIRVVEQIAASGDRSDTAMRLAHQLLSRDQLCEPLYRALMRLCAAGGDRAAALKLYATCRDTLKQELGITPDLQTETLYRDILTERPAPEQPALPSTAVDEKPSIAVLPFDNLSRDPELDYLCEGLAEDITTGLGRFRLLFVIDRYSSAMIAKRASDLAEIGKHLGVAHLVQGSVQRQGERLRITVRLLDAASREQVWGETFDHALSDIANVPDRVTGSIVSMLHSRVESSLIERSRRKPKLAAYDCLLRGVKHLRGYTPGDNERAVELFQRAMDLDPDYALARAYRGFADVVKYGYDNSPQDILDKALALASSAVEMDEFDGRCHWLLGMIAGYYGDLKKEERHYRDALALNPNDANAIATLGGVAAALGRIDEGTDLVRQAMRLNPYHPEWYWVELAIIFYMARRYEDALEAYLHRTNPGYWVLSRIAACYAQLERMEEAKAAAAAVLRLKPDFHVLKLRHAGWKLADTAHFQEGMRKAGLPD